MDDDWSSPYSPEVHEAAGMISMQANCTIEEAISWLWEHADEAQVAIEELAAAVIDRSIKFGE